MPSREVMENKFKTKFGEKDPNKIYVLLLSTTATPHYRRQPPPLSEKDDEQMQRRERKSTSVWALEEIKGHLEKTRPNDVVPITLHLQDLEFSPCEGNYSKAKNECSWPCQITLRDSNDQLNQVYYGLVDWADVVIIATPIRYGQPSALYYKMVERLTCVHNQLTLNDYNLILDKVAAFVITGGQDNIQAVAGSMMLFWSELGFTFAGHSYVGWSRGWNNEAMSSNYHDMTTNKEFREDLLRVVNDAIEMRERLKKAKLDPEGRPLPSSYSEYEVRRYLKPNSEKDPSSWKKRIICARSEIGEGHQKPFILEGGRHILIAQKDGDLFALDGICSHARVQFDEGKLRQNKYVQCSAHDATFTLDGKLKYFDYELYGCRPGPVQDYKEITVEPGMVIKRENLDCEGHQTKTLIALGEPERVKPDNGKDQEGNPITIVSVRNESGRVVRIEEVGQNDKLTEEECVYVKC